MSEKSQIKKQYFPGQSDLFGQNAGRLILKAVGHETLQDILAHCLDLTKTSGAICEANGDVAVGISSADWCQFLDSASCKPGTVPDSGKGVKKGKSACHEYCWSEISLESIKKEKTVEISCKGGIPLCSVPIFASRKVIGAMNIGIGPPPTDAEKLHEISLDYQVDFEELARLAKEYICPPPQIISAARSQLALSAKLIGQFVERKIAEDTLKENEATLHSAQEVARIGCWRYDPVTQQARWTDEMFRVFGMAPQAEVPSYSEHKKIIHPDDWPRFDAAVARAVNEGIGYDLELKVTYPQGGIGYVNTIGKPAKNRDDVVVELVGTVQDITDRKLAGLELKNKTNFLDRLIENSALSTWISDEKGTAIRANPACFEFFGATKEEVIGKYNLFKDAVLDKQGFLPMVRDVFEKGEPTEIVIDYDFSAVEHVDVENATHKVVKSIMTPILGEDGRVSNVIVQSIDLTEIKRAENALKESEILLNEVGNIAKIGGWEMDLLTRQAKWTKGTYDIADILPGDSVPGPDEHIDYYLPEYRPMVADAMERLITKNEPLDFVAPIKTVKGNIKWCRALGKGIWQNGKCVKIYGVFQDISEQKKVEDEKIILENQLRQAIKMQAVGTLAGGIAHEFNNLLSVIMGCTEMAQDEVPQDSFAKDQLDNVMQASFRVKDLVKQILSFSRQAQQKKSVVDLCLLVKESLKLIYSSIPTSICIEENIDPACGNIVADPTEIQQIIINLCSNAVWAMREKGSIAISLQPVGLSAREASSMGIEGGEYIKLSCGDCGVGMSNETKSRVFDPFFTTKEVGQGTGMGLSIVYSIMESYGGTITVESEAGKGSTFHLYFPVTDKPVVKKDVEKEEWPGGSESILLVDDELMFLEMGARMLSRLGYDVTPMGDSREALNAFILAPDKYDLMITDQIMPGLSGEELVREIRALKPEMPIILCTGYSSQINADKAKMLGINEFVHKPIVKKDIAKLLRKVLDRG